MPAATPVRMLYAERLLSIALVMVGEVPIIVDVNRWRWGLPIIVVKPRKPRAVIWLDNPPPKSHAFAKKELKVVETVTPSKAHLREAHVPLIHLHEAMRPDSDVVLVDDPNLVLVVIQGVGNTHEVIARV